MCRSLVFWKTSSTLMRGRVALRPLFLSSSAWVMDGSGAPSAPGRADRITSSYELGGRCGTGRSHSMSTTPFRPSRGLSFASLAVIALLAGCHSLQTNNNLLGVITPYQIEIVQGNVITREQAALIKPGLTRAQVRDVLGSPLLTDPFHADRWDYVFTIRRQGAEPQLRRVVVLFKGDALESIYTGGELPGERDFVALIDTYQPPSTPPPLALTDEQLKGLPAPVRAAASEPALPAPARIYPPLAPRS